MSESLVDRVALALWALSEDREPAPEAWPDDVSQRQRELWGDYARAAIEAMKAEDDAPVPVLNAKPGS